MDDKRLYRKTDAPLPPPLPAKPKASSKKAKAAVRASKRRKAANGETSTTDVEESANPGPKEEEKTEIQDDLFGGQKWECICITLQEYEDLLATLEKSRDLDERNLHKKLKATVLPDVVKAEEDRLKKVAKREKEMLALELARTAKRSSRLAGKQEKERQEREAAEAAKKREADLIAAKKDLQRQKEMEAARESRMQTREQRLKEREYKRILHEEELANLSDNSKKLETGEGRLSERRLKAEVEKKKRELEKLKEEDEWFFDCAKCGVHGENLVCSLTPCPTLYTDSFQDDGTHSVACETCNVWQHSACLGISQEEAEKDDFHFVCIGCKRKVEDAKKPKIPALKFKLGTSSSPPVDKAEPKKRKHMDGQEVTPRLPPIKKFKHTNGTLPTIENGGITFIPRPQASHIGYTRTPASSNSSFSPSRATPYGNGYTPHISTPSNIPPTYHHTPPYTSHTNGNLEGSWAHPNQGPNPFASPYQPYKAAPGSFGFNAYYTPNGQPSLPPVMPNSYAHPSPYKLETPNGHLTHPQQSSLLPPPHQSPLKQSTPSSLSAPVHGSSSPIIPPPRDEQQTRLAGLSPTKQSPPRPTSAQKLPSVLPPITALQPSPQVHNYEAPIKKMAPSAEQVEGNGLGNRVVFDPPVVNGSSIGHLLNGTGSHPEEIL